MKPLFVFVFIFDLTLDLYAVYVYELWNIDLSIFLIDFTSIHLCRCEIHKLVLLQPFVIIRYIISWRELTWCAIKVSQYTVNSPVPEFVRENMYMYEHHYKYQMWRRYLVITWLTILSLLVTVCNVCECAILTNLSVYLDWGTRDSN